MAFSKKFKTLGDVLLTYQIRYQKENFEIAQEQTVSEAWLTEFEFDLNEIPFDASEAAIREVVIFPILRLAWKPFSQSLTLWGHKAIEADEILSGTPDYIIAKKSALGSIVFESPYVAVVEAKMDDFTRGWAQCALEMLAIQKINATEKKTNLPVFGIVTNGKSWQFGKLENHVFTEFRQIFILDNINQIVSVLTTIFDFYQKKLME